MNMPYPSELGQSRNAIPASFVVTMAPTRIGSSATHAVKTARGCSQGEWRKSVTTESSPVSPPDSARLCKCRAEQVRSRHSDVARRFEGAVEYPGIGGGN